MGNRMCKAKKTDVPTGGGGGGSETGQKGNGISAFQRIIQRLHLRPKSWKSESHLNDDTNKINRYQVNPPRSSDWTDVDLEVDAAQTTAPLSFTFDVDGGLPTPPPRQHKKKAFEVAAAATTKREVDQSADEEEVPVDEAVCVKKTVAYQCPCCQGPRDHVTCGHQTRPPGKSASVVSLPSYHKLSLIEPTPDLAYIDASVCSSANSLPNGVDKRKSSSSTRLEDYLTRARSFGSLLNSKLRQPAKKTSGDDAGGGDDDSSSFGGLEEWDLGMLEHYDPKDASLPRGREGGARLADVESLIEEVPKSATTHRPQSPQDAGSVGQTPPPPVRPVRRSESKKPSPPLDGGGVEDSPEHSSLMRVLRDLAAEPPVRKRSKGEVASEEMLKAEREVAVS